MKKLVLTAVLAVTIPLAVFSIDFGGNLDTSGIYYQDSDSTFYNSDFLYLWVSSDLPAGLKIYALGNAGYTTEDSFLFDLNYFKIENSEPSVISYALGRLNVSDFSGYVVNQRIDGASVVLNFPRFVISAEAGYTGFIFNRSSGIEMTLTDQSDGTDLLDFESPRAVAGAGIVFPELAGGFDVKADVWVQFDLRDDSDLVTGGGTLDTQYAGVSVSGQIVSGLYLDSFAYLNLGQTGYTDSAREYNITGYMGSAGLRYYIEDFLYSRISLRLLYSSGDSDYTGSFLEGDTSGDSTMFTPVSSKPLALVFSPQPGNISFARLSYSVKPFSKAGNSMLENLQAELTSVNFFRSTTGLISESGINSSSDSLYLGTEIDGTVNFRPFSDLGLSLSGGVFIPDNSADGAFDASQRDVEFLVRAGLSFSF